MLSFDFCLQHTRAELTSFNDSTFLWALTQPYIFTITMYLRLIEETAIMLSDRINKVVESNTGSIR